MVCHPLEKDKNSLLLNLGESVDFFTLKPTGLKKFNPRLSQGKIT
jgi:hypothetical protein